MQVLFLDIDGVLNSHKTCLIYGGFPHGLDEKNLKKFDHAAIKLIQRICLASKTSIVLSSSWRIIHDWKEIGEVLSLPIIDKTPHSSPKGHHRGYQIQDWLDLHPEVLHYAIIDDDSDMLEHQMPYFVKTKHEDGITWSDAEKLANMLGINIWDCSDRNLEELLKIELDWIKD